MDIKGSAVKSIQDFVKKKYPNRYNEWIDSLSDSSKRIMKNPVFSSSWYPMQEAAIEPTGKVGDIFYKDENVGAWVTGRHSAETTLKGVYRIFVKAASPSYIIAKTGKIFSTYYRPSEMKVVKSSNNNVVLHILKFEQPSAIIENRIGGWMEAALELSGCKNIKILITKSLAKGDTYTEYFINWN